MLRAAPATGDRTTFIAAPAPLRNMLPRPIGPSFLPGIAGAFGTIFVPAGFNFTTGAGTLDTGAI